MSKSQKINTNTHTHTKDKQQERKIIKEKKNLPAKSEKKENAQETEKKNNKWKFLTAWQLIFLHHFTRMFLHFQCKYLKLNNFSSVPSERPKRIICLFFHAFYILCYHAAINPTTTKTTHFSVWCLTFWHNTKFGYKEHKFMQS